MISSPKETELAAKHEGQMLMAQPSAVKAKVSSQHVHSCPILRTIRVELARRFFRFTNCEQTARRHVAGHAAYSFGAAAVSLWLVQDCRRLEGRTTVQLGLRRAVLKEILRLLGIMEDQPLDDASKAAGGYKANDASVLKSLKAKVAELKLQATKGGAIQLRQVNVLQSKLASFAESDEVKNLILGMLKDLETREDILDKSMEDTKSELASHTDKLVKYQQEVVDLSNAADKAQQQADAKNLQRQGLNGDKINAAETYDNEHAEFVLISPPAERSIFILQTIMAKITKFCEGEAGGEAAAAV